MSDSIVLGKFAGFAGLRGGAAVAYTRRICHGDREVFFVEETVFSSIYDAAPRASWSAQLIPYLSATFWLVKPMGMMQSLASFTPPFSSPGHSCVGTASEQ